MPLSSGTKLGPYEIRALLGAGGMGEVYRAKDTKLDRDVAIKVLPAAVAQDPERLARFEREAKVLASLNHPNIAQIYGVEDRALVMELVEGQTLKGPLPSGTAIGYFRQIADALEAAHEKGIVHRDLKPANIMITPAGVVKVLDFGLAAVAAQVAPVDDASLSPTLSFRATQAGTIMGTAAYMSPEQAAGKLVDKRSDIWSFGVVLWETLTGHRLFEGEAISHTMAEVIRAPIDLGKLPKDTPPAIRNLLGRCLDRDVKKRLRDIGEARVILENPLAGTPEPVTAPRTQSWVPWIAAALFFALAATVGLIHFREAPREQRLVRTYIPPPDLTTFNSSTVLGTVGPVSLSPDGRTMTFSAKAADGKNQLWIRPLDALTAQPLAGTENAIHPFWSPDSRFIGFFADSKLKRIETSGGPPITLCDAPGARGGAWSRSGVIVFAQGYGAGGETLHGVSVSGGAVTPLPMDLPGRWPSFLPDGRHFLFSSYTSSEDSKVCLGSLNSKETTVLMDALTDAVYSQGYLIYLHDDSLMAQPFDLKKLTLSGEAVPIAQNVRSVGAHRRGVFSVSENGILVYQSGTGQGQFALTWYDRAGKRLGVLGEASRMTGVYFSPDRKSVATFDLDALGRTYDIWLFDVARGLRTRFTFGGGSELLASLVWSPDGKSIVFASKRAGKFGLYRKASNLTGNDELLYAGGAGEYPTNWSPDGKFILYGRPQQGGLFALPLTGERKPFSIAQNAVDPRFGQFSPDGHWIAYASIDSGRSEVYVVPFPGTGGRLQVSTASGDQPRWRSDGKELFYVDPVGQLMSAEVSLNGANLKVGRVQPLFSGLLSGSFFDYDVALDGQRFLALAPIEQTGPDRLTVVQNWASALKK